MIFFQSTPIKINKPCMRTKNEMCAPPPGVNLPPLEEIVHVLSCFPNGSFLITDLRHWFHQIRIPNLVGKYFSIRCCGRIFEMRVLSMGFSWASYIAQCTAWVILLRCVPTGYDAQLVRCTTQMPPGFLWIVSKRTTKKMAVLLLCYDISITSC